MSQRNRWKIMSTSKPDKPRRRLDDYETPPDNTLLLRHHVKFKGPILEPACGSGRMVRALRESYPGIRVTGTDVKTGHDFTKRTKPWAGDIATNPPYRDGLADLFTNKALQLADGRVAMLMQSGFAWGSRRYDSLYAHVKPDLILIIPWRIHFFEGPEGPPIDSQFFTHAWYVWPDRKTRERGGYKTQVDWASPPEFG
ncbi:hypothetical protein ACJMQP_03950 [Rhodopseudomonas palustris]